MKRHASYLLLASLTLAGCTETVAPSANDLLFSIPQRSPRPSATVPTTGMKISADEVPSDAPPELTCCSTELSVLATAEFKSFDPHNFIGSGKFTYYANKYSFQVDGSINGSDQLPSKTITAQNFPWPESAWIILPVSVYTDAYCGHWGSTYAHGYVAMNFADHNFYEKENTDTKTANQPSCPQNSGSNQYALLICLTVDYYSANAEYLGSDKSCEWHEGSGDMV